VIQRELTAKSKPANTIRSNKSAMSWNVFTTANAKRQLKRLPGNIAFRLLETFESLRENPWEGDTVKLSGTENEWRRRVGAYRFKFRVFQFVIV
jgi:mRNA interferase RelE/StbE